MGIIMKATSFLILFFFFLKVAFAHGNVVVMQEENRFETHLQQYAKVKKQKIENENLNIELSSVVKVSH